MTYVITNVKNYITWEYFGMNMKVCAKTSQEGS